jgi:rod shape-determining protein MreC
MSTTFKKKNLFLLLFIGFFIIVLHYSGITSPIEGVIVKGLNPIRKQIYRTSRNFRSYFYVMTHYDEIKDENNDLKDRLINYVIDVSHIKKLEDENLVLKQELNYFETIDKKLILAEVVSGFYLEGDSLLVINRGSKNGIAVGMPVVFGSGIIVGKVIKVKDWSADILLLSNKNSLMTATIEGEDKVNGIIKGDVDYSLQMDYIPSDLEINDGDIVLTSGLEEKIPKGLVIGQVKEIFFEDGDFFKTAIVYPLVDYQSIDFVSIILD